MYAEAVLHGSQLNFLLQFHHVIAKDAVGIHQVFHRLARVNNGSMISSAKMFTNSFE